MRIDLSGVPRSLEQHIVAIFAPRQPLFQKGALSGLKATGAPGTQGRLRSVPDFARDQRFLQGILCLGPHQAGCFGVAECPAGEGAVAGVLCVNPARGTRPDGQ